MISAIRIVTFSLIVMLLMWACVDQGGTVETQQKAADHAHSEKAPIKNNVNAQSNCTLEKLKLLTEEGHTHADGEEHDDEEDDHEEGEDHDHEDGDDTKPKSTSTTKPNTSSSSKTITNGSNSQCAPTTTTKAKENHDHDH
jgi:hypothetical protein